MDSFVKPRREQPAREDESPTEIPLESRNVHEEVDEAFRFYYAVPVISDSVIRS